MSTQVQYRRGTGAQNDAFTGALGEITVDTTNWTLRIHNGTTAGGAGNLATVAYVTSQISSLSSNSISFGTSSVSVLASGGNVQTNVGGATISTQYSGGVLITGTVSASGNITGGNVLTAIVSASGNVTAANYLTAGLISATGNITGGNISATNHTGTTVSVTGNITGGNVITAGVLLNSAISTSGNVTGANYLTAGLISATGNITGGNLTVGTGTVTFNNVVNGGASATGNIGTTALPFNTVFAKATSAQYADVAERYRADADYPVGTVLTFGGSEEVTQSKITHDTAIAGTVSENPAYIMNDGLESKHVATVALLGRVPCRVIGTIQKGDLLVSSQTPGVATMCDQTQYQPGCVIGKALENYNSETEGIIEIVVGRL